MEESTMNLKKLSKLLLPIVENAADMMGVGQQFDAAEKLVASIKALVEQSGVDLDDPTTPLATKIAALDAKLATMNTAVDSAIDTLRG
jgi:hypothetical protein